MTALPEKQKRHSPKTVALLRMIPETVCSCGLASRSVKWFEITSRGKSKGGRTCRHRLKIKASDQPMVRSRPTRHAFNGQCCLPLALHVRRIFRRPPRGLNEPIRVCLAHLPSLTAVALERTEILPIESRISSNIAFFLLLTVVVLGVG